MTGPLASSYAFVECMKLESTGKIYNIDINRCRKNQLYYSKYNFPLFTVMDQREVFKSDTIKKPGLYYVETEQYFPFRGNGWYSQPMVEYGLNLKVINITNIKSVIYSSMTIPKNYFNEYIDHLYATAIMAN